MSTTITSVHDVPLVDEGLVYQSDPDTNVLLTCPAVESWFANKTCEFSVHNLFPIVKKIRVQPQVLEQKHNQLWTTKPLSGLFEGRYLQDYRRRDQAQEKVHAPPFPASSTRLDFSALKKPAEFFLLATFGEVTSDADVESFVFYSLDVHAASKSSIEVRAFMLFVVSSRVRVLTHTGGLVVVGVQTMELFCAGRLPPAPRSLAEVRPPRRCVRRVHAP